jgi:dTDP-4-amino-4,6-dideoxygalactose transaminase
LARCVTQSASPRAPRRCILRQSLRVSVQAMKCWFQQTRSSGLYGEFGTVWGIMYAGETPVLCDVDRATGTIDVRGARSRVSGTIIPVHLYGQPADMDGVMTFAAERDLLVIEDAAQSIGASWAGRLTGTIGQFGCSNNAALAQRVRSLRNHGQRERYVHDELGFNYRMDGLQAACKLKLLASWTSERKALAKVYDRILAELPLELPKVVNQDHVWHPHVVRTPQREGLRNHLQAQGSRPTCTTPCRYIASLALRALPPPDSISLRRIAGQIED